MRGSLQARSGAYYAVFRVNGKQLWKNLGIPTSRGNKRRAEAALNKLLAEYSENPNMFNKIEFSDYINRWLEKSRSRLIQLHMRDIKTAPKSTLYHISVRKI